MKKKDIIYNPEYSKPLEKDSEVEETFIRASDRAAKAGGVATVSADVGSW